jgi:hypothetical protein
MPPKKRGGKNAPVVLSKHEKMHQAKQSKQEERNVRMQMRKHRKAQEYGDAEWKSDFAQFLVQLQPLGLTIKDVAGDGNCLFRAIADQIEGDPSKHAQYRQRIMAFIESHREDFEFFVEDNEPFELYVNRLFTNAEWGGQSEIQAASLLLGVNVIIHHLAQPRWTVTNFADQPGIRTIHLSYHNGTHYSSVRRLDDPNLNRNGEAPMEIKLVDSSVAKKSANSSKEAKRPKAEWEQYYEYNDEYEFGDYNDACETETTATNNNSDFVDTIPARHNNDFFEVTDEEVHIMALTGCTNAAFVHRLWMENEYDSAGTVVDCGERLFILRLLCCLLLFFFFFFFGFSHLCVTVLCF